MEALEERNLFRGFFIHDISKNSPQITTGNVRICFLFVLLFSHFPQMSAENFNFYEKTGEILLIPPDEFSNFTPPL